MTLDDALPPVLSITPWQWLRRNLFNTWYNSLLTLVCLWLLFQVLQAVLGWVFTQAQWTVVQTNLRLFFIGRYPPNLAWRLWLVLGIVVGLAGLSWGSLAPARSPWFKRGVTIVTAIALGVTILLPLPLPPRLWLGAIALLLFGSFWLGRRFATLLKPQLVWAWLGAFPILLWLIGGGLGLRSVSTNFWNGLLLTMLLATTSIVLAFPFSVLLALGRQSNLPVVRWFCTLFVEIVRGLPLIGILFLAQVMLPLILPVELRLDRLLRAIAGLVLFNAAYLAENVRAGLQAVPRGQSEAARALGLNPLWVLWLIVLPQALRVVIPAIVGQFISLFKDTSLLSIFALVELTGIARSILAQPQFLGRYAEVYLFVGLLYWIVCYSMSIASRRLEQHLGVGHKRT
ncbi:amino acid ABC transporter permease [Trichocoleus sp. FACHB-591]|uniref:amino acid ABC transporter permease n=1 Tax=Trichocoleus sp. FACHB-591 TaxID=2692872 RepID=UPI001686B7C5|nr:amino acid ABC transporter permease [Trichocoleus sp. FACHB-591]MBD2098993.1 amino acid ABC transporter permease [Trichocoleus sp. FACHB-591]